MKYLVVYFQSEIGHFQFAPAILLTTFSLVATLLCCASATDLDSVTMVQFDGTTVTATIDSIDIQGNLTGSDLPDGLHLRDILTVKADRPIERNSEFGVTIFVTGGGRLYVRNPVITPESVGFQSAAGISEFPLANLRAIAWDGSADLEQQIGLPSADSDSVIVATDNGERKVNGIVELLNGEQLQINYQNESRKIGVEKIKAVIMADIGLDGPSGSAATIELTDGSSIVGVIRELADQKLKLQLAGSGFLEIDTGAIANILIQSDRLVYLSDLEPADVQQRNEFTLQRSWQKDRSVELNRLAIRVGKTDKIIEFNKGLGTQSFTQLIYDNTNEYDRFQATVGINVETNGHGDCLLVVRGDGIELWSQRIRGNHEPVDLDVAIGDMRRIALVVYPGEEFDLADHADWGNARFIKTK
jgi:hypothetical protein